MSELRKANSNVAYFVTLTVVGWLDIFTRRRYCDILIDSLRYCSINKSLEVFSYVIMPSHAHLIVRDVNGELYNTLRDFKRFTAQSIIKSIQTDAGESRRAWLIHMLQFHAKYQKQNERFSFWQKTSYPIELSFDSVYLQKCEYIHNNPVEAGYVTQADYWHYSSASPDSPFEVLQP